MLKEILEDRAGSGTGALIFSFYEDMVNATISPNSCFATKVLNYLLLRGYIGRAQDAYFKLLFPMVTSNTGLDQEAKSARIDTTEDYFDFILSSKVIKSSTKARLLTERDAYYNHYILAERLMVVNTILPQLSIMKSDVERWESYDTVLRKVDNLVSQMNLPSLSMVAFSQSKLYYAGVLQSLETFLKGFHETFFANKTVEQIMDVFGLESAFIAKFALLRIDYIEGK